MLAMEYCTFKNKQLDSRIRYLRKNLIQNTKSREIAPDSFYDASDDIERTIMKLTAHEHNIQALKGLGCVVAGNTVLLLLTDPSNNIKKLYLATSKNGLSFQTLPEIVNLQHFDTMNLDIADARIGKRGDEYYLTYPSTRENGLTLSVSSELLHWGRLTTIKNLGETGLIVSDYKKSGKYCMLFGDKNINIAYSKDLLTWQIDPVPLLTPTPYNWEQPTEVSLQVGNACVFPKGIVLVYFVKVHSENETNYAIQAVLLDKLDPKKLLWQSEILWDSSEEWARNKLKPFGIVYFKNRLISYWNYENRGIFSIQHASLTNLLERKHDQTSLYLRRVDSNPIIKPSNNSWENKATFNPGAIVKNESVHLVYRAIGDQDLSVIGYAKSGDGTTIDTRLNHPVFIAGIVQKALFDSAVKFMSGGGYGGCEDPRLTNIDGKVYMTYVAYDGYSAPRIALTSIPEEDFFEGHFEHWSEPVIISRPHVVNKNAVIFPEKINGKYVIMHRVFPNILIDYRDSLTFEKNDYLRGDAMIKPRKLFWDSRKIGAGPPPIKTEKGWLLIYHSVGDQDPGRYKMGAMLLDLVNPTKVIARSRRPILTPDHPHENNGHKAGVAYPCGGVHFKDKLIVYYGGADSVGLAAEANMDEFLKELEDTKTPRLTPLTFN